MGIQAVTAHMNITAARLTGRLRRHDRQDGLARQDPAGLWRAEGQDAGHAGRPAGQPSRLRSFDPARVADHEYRAGGGYYRHEYIGISHV